jgi:hypothetical protein
MSPSIICVQLPLFYSNINSSNHILGLFLAPKKMFLSAYTCIIVGNVVKTGPEIEPVKLPVYGSTGSTAIEPDNY